MSIEWKIRDLKDIPIRCYARRGGPRSKVFCEEDALHKFNHYCDNDILMKSAMMYHCGRSETGKWFSWL